MKPPAISYSDYNKNNPLTMMTARNSQQRFLPKTFHRLKISLEFIRQKIAPLCKYPLRYLGSKRWSIIGICLRSPYHIFQRVFHEKPLDKKTFFGAGYHYSMQKKVNEVALKELLRYVAYSTMPFSHDDKNWIAPFGTTVVNLRSLSIDLKAISKNTAILNNEIVDSTSPLKALVLEDDNELIVVFGPMHSFWNHQCTSLEKKKILHIQQINALKSYLGGNPRFFKQADCIVSQMKSIAEQRNKKLIVVGQSLAGAIASYSALKNEVEAICINSMPLGVGLQRAIGNRKLIQADRFVTHLSSSNDFASNFPTKFFDVFLNLCGLRTPGNFGKRWQFKSFYKQPYKSHCYPIRSIMVNLGYGLRTKPSGLNPQDIVASKTQ